MKKDINLLKNMTVLFIDDDEIFLEEMKIVLKSFFKTVYVYSNPLEAFKKYQQNSTNIDLIMTDIRMPDLSGLEFCKKVRDTNKNIPIIICSSHTDIDELIESIRYNLVDYIVKPISYEKLKKSFELFLEKYNINTKFYLNEFLTYDYGKKVIVTHLEEISLSKKESLLLELLIENVNSTVTNEEIEARVYDYEHISKNAIRNLVYRLRPKLEGITIETVREFGFSLKV